MFQGWRGSFANFLRRVRFSLAPLNGFEFHQFHKNKFGYSKLMLYICIPMKKNLSYYSSLLSLLSNTQAGEGM